MTASDTLPKQVNVAVWGQHRNFVFRAAKLLWQAVFGIGCWHLSRWLLQTVHGTFPDASVYQLAVGGTFILHQIVFWSVNAFFTWVDLWRPRLLYQYKIQTQPKDQVTWPIIVNCAKRCLFNQFAVLLPMNYLSISFWQSRGLEVSPDTMPDPLTSVYQLAGMALCHEFFFFYGHYVAHWKRIYKYVHKIHHEFFAPISMSSEYAHVIEMAVCNVWPVMAGGVLLGVHLQTMWLFMIIGLLTTANAHCGYRFPFSPFGDNTMHDYHHSAQKDNYGTLGILDFLHGTTTSYDQFVASMERAADAAQKKST